MESASPPRDRWNVAIDKETLKMITREAGKGVADVVQYREQAAAATRKAKDSEEDFDRQVATLQTKLRDLTTTGVEDLAISAAAGFGAGGGLAYILHDQVKEYFGADSIFALAALPVAGVVIVAATPKMLKDPAKKPGENANKRAAGYGFGMGMAAVGAYLSYEDYSAQP